MHIANSYRFNKEPILSFTTDQSTLTTVSILVSIALSEYTYLIDFGDGTDIDELANVSTITHDYTIEGTYTIKIYEYTAKAEHMTAFTSTFSNLTGSADFSNVPNLQYLRLRGNYLSDFDLGENSSIHTLDIRVNEFTGTLDLTDYTTLEILYLDYCTYDSVILDGLSALTTYLEYNSVGTRMGSNLTSFSCVGCSSLGTIIFDGQSLTSLDVTGCVNLQTFKIHDVDLTDSSIIGLSAIETIQTLWLRSSGITQFPNFSTTGLKTLTSIGYVGSEITEIDLTDCDNLLYFGESVYNYGKVNLENVILPSVKTNLLRLNISNAYITGDIDVTEYSNLTNFEFERNSGITSVNCSGLANVTMGESRYLRGLDSITSLDFSDTSFDFRTQSNAMPYLVDIDVSNCDLTIITLYDSSLPAEQVNKLLEEADNAGNSDGSVYIVGNAASPDNNSGGYDGITAIANLEAKGWTVTTNLSSS